MFLKSIFSSCNDVWVEIIYIVLNNCNVMYCYYYYGLFKIINIEIGFFCKNNCLYSKTTFFHNNHDMSADSRNSPS